MIFNRPWIVLVQFLSVLILAVVYWLRFSMAISTWDFLSSLPLAVPPVYHLISGFFWGLSGLLVGFWLWQGRSIAPAALRIFSVTFALYYWIEQLFVMTSELRQTNWLFLALVTGILISVVFLSFKPSFVRKFFGEKNEPEK